MCLCVHKASLTWSIIKVSGCGGEGGEGGGSGGAHVLFSLNEAEEAALINPLIYDSREMECMSFKMTSQGGEIIVCCMLADCTDLLLL